MFFKIIPGAAKNLHAKPREMRDFCVAPLLPKTFCRESKKKPAGRLPRQRVNESF
jgi:hypothetical protein